MIHTWSKFNYGFDVTMDNCFLSFSEGGEELIAEIPFGSYTIGEGIDLVATELNNVGSLQYAVAIDRSTHLVTISADGPFELLTNNGSTAANSIFPILGFSGADKTGQSNYTASDPCGKQYYPQFKLQSYVPKEHFIESADATVNKSADGRVEVVRFGLEQKIELDIKFITNLAMDGVHIKNNPQGVEDALDFLGYISQKKRFEFVPDVDDPDTFVKVILESFPGFGKGTGFKLKELISQNLPDIYETGVFQLRVVT